MTTITCPRCRADKLGMQIDSALDELQRPSGKTNRFHSESCSMVSAEVHEATFQLRRLSIGASCWVLSTLPVRCIGLDAYIVGDPADSERTPDAGAAVDQTNQREPTCGITCGCSACWAYWGTETHPLERKRPAPLTLERVVVCAVAELASKVARSDRAEATDAELQQVIAAVIERQREHELLEMLTEMWSGLDSAPGRHVGRIQPGFVPRDHWVVQVLRWLRANDPGMFKADIDSATASVLAACQALGFLAKPSDKPRLVHGYSVAYLTTRAVTYNSMPKDTVLCHECAVLLPADMTEQHPHWEGEPLECDNCNEPIESSYGVPDEARA